MICNICNHPAEAGYVNEAAGERCVDSCHTITDCPGCGYAAVGGLCHNPVCDTVNPTAAAHWAEEWRKNEAERIERERLAEIRARAMRPAA